MTPPLGYELEALRKSLSPTFSLQVDRLTIAPGEILCLLGPTGSGKSTLLRVLSGLEPIATGRRVLNGSEHRDPFPLETLRRIATVHQRPLLLSQSVRYNVEYPLRIRRASSPSERAEAMLDRLGILRLANQDARTLSGGQTQLVALARALVVDPGVLLLDEPTANLDPAYVAVVEQAVQERQQQTNMTVVWATHNLFQARRVAHRVALLLGGNLIEADDVDDVFDRPADERTANFVHGKMVY